MLKKIVLSLSAVVFLFVAGTSFAADLNSAYIMNGKTSKAEILSLFGEPGDISKDGAGRDKYIYVRDGSRLDVTFNGDVVWDSQDDSAN